MKIKRYILAGAAAATLAGGAFAFAANLDVDSSTLASGSTTVDNDCDDVDVDWDPEFAAGSNAYLIDEITVTGNAGCAEDEVVIAVEFVTGAPVEHEGDFDALVDVNDTDAKETFAVNYDAANIKEITVLATGADDNA